MSGDVDTITNCVSQLADDLQHSLTLYNGFGFLADSCIVSLCGDKASEARVQLVDRFTASGLRSEVVEQC